MSHLKHSGILTDPNNLNLAGKRQQDSLPDGTPVTVVIVITLRDIQVQASNPVAVLDPHSPEDGAELGQGVECDGIVAQHACLLDSGQQENLLHAGFSGSGNGTLDICRAQS